MCDTACSNSWLSDSFAVKLDLKSSALKLTFKWMNPKELIDTMLAELIVTPQKDQNFEAFVVRSYVRNTLNIGSVIIHVKSRQDTYPHLPVLDPKN